MKTIRITPGLGNQMFQYALILNYKLKGEEIYFDLSPCLHSKKHNSYELKRIFNINIKEVSFWDKFKLIGPSFYIGSREITILKLINKIIQKTVGGKYMFNTSNYIFEKEHSTENHFNEKYLNLEGDKYMAGYFNSSKYFENIKDEVRKNLAFPNIESTDENNLNLLKDILNSESISLHVRRGDYVGTNLDVCDSDYFENSFYKIVDKLKERNVNIDNIKIFIFSDDINWCKENLKFLKDFSHNFVDWNKKENSYKDMQLMSICKHNIIPNSTFSWWSAYLNNNNDKIVITPEYRFRSVLTSKGKI